MLGLRSYQQALTIYQNIKNRQGEGNALGNLGNAYSSLGDYPKAIEYHQQHLAIHLATHGLLDELGEAGLLAYGNPYLARTLGQMQVRVKVET